MLGERRFSRGSTPASSNYSGGDYYGGKEAGQFVNKVILGNICMKCLFTYYQGYKEHRV